MSPTEKFMPAYLILAIAFITSFWLLNKDIINQAKIDNSQQSPDIVEQKFIKPDYVRGIYLTAYSAGNKNYRQAIIDKMKDSRINTVIIDIKDYSGYILYSSELAALKEINAIKHRMKDIKKILDEFHQAGIYVVARQTVFQDPVLAQAKPELAFKTLKGNIWYDNKNLAWVDPNKKEVWQYNLAIAKEAVDLGFDEINFDYMRYPSDGDMAILNYNIPEGKRLGVKLKEIEDKWVENNFEISKLEVQKIIRN